MTAPWPRTATLRDGALMAVGGVAVTDLVERFGTPLQLLDRDELLVRAGAYRAAFADADVVYAAKALCVTGVLQLVAAEGLWVDVASAGELATAARAGVPPERTVLHGNNKSLAELEAAVAHGVARVVVDSFDELARVDLLGRRRGRPVDCWLRVTPGVVADTHRAIATGSDDVKFGFVLSAGAADAAVARAVGLEGVALRGLHCHVGSQVTDLADLTAAVEPMVALLGRVTRAHGLVLGELDLGGGLGIAHEAGDFEPDVDAYAAALRRAVGTACARHHVAVPRLAVEPGRSVVGPAGVTLYRVGTVKDTPGVRRWAAVDGGMSDNLRPALYGARYTFAPAGRSDFAEAAVATAVAGKHCESGDVLADAVGLPADLVPGDLLAVAATGAYTHSLASNYNRLPRPAMVLVGGGHAVLLVRRETVDDVLARDVALDAEGVFAPLSAAAGSGGGTAA